MLRAIHNQSLALVRATVTETLANDKAVTGKNSGRKSQGLWVPCPSTAQQDHTVNVVQVDLTKMPLFKPTGGGNTASATVSACMYKGNNVANVEQCKEDTNNSFTLK